MPVRTEIASPHDAIAAMLDRLASVAVEPVLWRHAAGRVLASPIVTDRPSPPADVSAMDGYAVRLADLATSKLPIVARTLPGRPAATLPPGACVQVMTGAVVPADAEAVIKREDVDERDDHIVVGPSAAAAITDDSGQSANRNIRRRGENEAAGATVVDAGVSVTPSVMAAIASFNAGDVRVRRRVRVAVIVTGDELLDPGSPAADWQIRDSNGPTLAALLGVVPWVELLAPIRVTDDADAMSDAVRRAIAECDALFVTGGVSAGTHDFVPAALAAGGCQTVFHKLPLRPGRPVLGAIGPDGQLVMGLPGNPLSVMCTARRIGAPLLRCRAGFAMAEPPTPRVELTAHDGRDLHLWWYRPVSLTADGRATLTDSRGSGDLVSAARSDGFVELPPHATTTGPWPYFAWNLQ